MNYAVCKRYFETFETRNPNFKIVNCVWHNEEGGYNKYYIWEYGTPHPHLCFVPIATGYKQGLARQVSIGHALMNMGYTDTKEDYVDEDGKTKPRTVCAYTLWERNEVQYLEELLQEEYSKYCKKNKAYAKKHGKLEIIHPVQGRNAESLAPKEYAQKQRLLEEISDISAQLEEKLQQLSALSSVEIKTGKKFLSPKIKRYMNEDEYNAILQACEILEKLTANLIAGDEYLKKAKKEREAAEEKYKAADELYRNEEKHIQEQAERRAVQIAENHKKDLDEQFEAEIENFKKNYEKTYHYMKKYIEKTTDKSVDIVLAEYFGWKKKYKLNETIQDMNIPQRKNSNLSDEHER